MTAIDGGPDGLRLIDVCLGLAADHLGADGILLLQVAAPAQAHLVEKRLRPELGLRSQDRRVTDSVRAVLAIGVA
jgi:hypothetical protein